MRPPSADAYLDIIRGMRVNSYQQSIEIRECTEAGIEISLAANDLENWLDELLAWSRS